jgi:hypothetical protein
MRDELLDHGW